MTFVKGVSGNPNGRPKDGESWAGMLSKICNEIDGEDALTRKEIICRKLIAEASRGEQWAVQALIDRIDGKSKISIDQNVTTVSVEISQDDADAVT